jgi:hypothetical protein
MVYVTRIAPAVAANEPRQNAFKLTLRWRVASEMEFSPSINTIFFCVWPRRHRSTVKGQNGYQKALIARKN